MTVAVSVDSITTEEEKAKPSTSSPNNPTRKARSSPRTTTVTSIFGKPQNESSRETTVQDGDSTFATDIEIERS